LISGHHEVYRQALCHLSNSTSNHEVHLACTKSPWIWPSQEGRPKNKWASRGLLISGTCLASTRLWVQPPGPQNKQQPNKNGTGQERVTVLVWALTSVSSKYCAYNIVTYSTWLLIQTNEHLRAEHFLEITNYDLDFCEGGSMGPLEVLPLLLLPNLDPCRPHSPDPNTGECEMSPWFIEDATQKM
jgi:hypothetical protein